jgi:Mn-dependent DtxR family transcriptional regulator
MRFTYWVKMLTNQERIDVLTIYGRGYAGERLRYLLDIHPEYWAETHEAIAEILCVTREVVTRMFKQLDPDGRLRKQARRGMLSSTTAGKGG